MTGCVKHEAPGCAGWAESSSPTAGDSARAVGLEDSAQPTTCEGGVGLRLLTVHARQSPPLWRFLSPVALLANLWRHRHLIGQLASREIRGRYQGSYLGLLWTLLTPLGMLVAYTFVFQFVLKARWGVSRNESALEFGLTLFAGLLVFNLFAETISRAPGLILGQPNFVKKVVFPLEILPVTSLLGALAHIGVSLVIVWAASGVLIRPPGWQTLWFPVLVLPYLALLLGLGWLVAALGTFLRDLGPTIAVAVQLLVFLTPVFYPLERVPERWRPLMQANPLAVFVENSRRVLLWDQPPDWLPLGLASLFALVLMLLGYACFMKSKRAFADVV